MSNRFHNKFHRQNHHSNPTVEYPDSALDPIASFEQPFQGEFFSQGDIITTQNLSAGIDLFVGNDGTIENDLTVKGNLNVFGETTQLDTLVYATSALSVTNSGTGPAATFKQTGNEPVAVFYDDNNTALYVDGKTATPGYVGIGTSAPSEKLHVQGNAKITGTVEAANIGTGEDNSVVILDSDGKLRTDEINPSVWDTTMKMITASDGALTVNYLTRAENATGINESIVKDDGSAVTVEGDFLTDGTATIGTIATNSIGTSVLIENSGLVQKRTLNAAAFNTTARFVSASDDFLTVNRLTKATNSNGINESIVWDNGANVGIDTDTPGAKLTINGTLSSSSTVEFPGIGIGEDNSVVILDSDGKIRTDEINPSVWDTTMKVITASDGALTVNYLTKAENAAGINESIVRDDGVLVTVEGNFLTDGTATIGTIATNTTGTSVLIENSGLVQKRTLNTAAFNTTARFVSASDDFLTVNRLTKATDSNGINESIVWDSGTNVGIDTDTPGAKLTVKGTLSSSSTVEFPGIGTGEDNSVVILDSDGKLRTDEINPSVWSTGTKFISATDGNLNAGYIPVAENALGLDSSVIYQNGTNIGIGTTDPKAALDIRLGTNNLSAISFSENENSRMGISVNLIPVGGDNSIAIYSAGYGAGNDNDDIAVFKANGNVGIGINPTEKLHVGGNLKTSGTATIGTIANSLTNTSVVVETAGLLQKRTLNVAAFDTTSKFVSASDGALTVNRLTKATNSNGIDESIVWDSGTRVGIGTDNPGATLDVDGDAIVQTDLTVKGNFTVLGTTSQLDTLVYATSAVSITNAGTGPALTVTQTGTEPIAHFIDSNGDDIIFDDNGYVGLGVASPSEKLDISGNLKTTGTAKIGTLAANSTGTSVVVETAGLLQKRTLNVAAFDTTSRFVSATDDNLDAGYIPVAKNALGLDSSVIYQDGVNIGVGLENPVAKLHVGGNLKISGTTTLGIIFDSPTNTSVIVQTAGLLQKRTLNAAAFDTTSKYVSASDGALTVNRLTKATNSNGIDESIVWDSGTNVGIDTDNPGAKLTVSGTLSSSSTVNFGGIGTGTDNSVVILDANGFLRTDEIDSRAWGSSLVDGSGVADYLTKWSDGNTVTTSIVFEDSINSRIGISDETPEEKLDVDGNIRSTGLIIPGSATVTPTTTTALPTDNDVILNNQTGPVTITGFSSGRTGVTYTLTNYSSHKVTISTSANLTVRGGNTWAGYTCSSNPDGKIELPQYFSCSLRMRSATQGSVW